MKSTRDVIRHFITTNFYVADPARLDDAQSLLEGGILDSTGVVEMLTFLEEQFGIQIADRDIVPENFDSIERLDAFVTRSRASRRVTHDDAHP
jgi:acyl carrier protein